jgi:DNA-binding response OmpR family regulator
MDGFTVIPCPRGGDVLNAIETEKPALLLMDYHLADMKGNEVLEVLKAIRAETDYDCIAVVMTSGLDVSVETLAAGADHFLLKPFEPGSLTNLFNDLIAKRAG